MSVPGTYQIRRATTDDVDKLREVWEAAHLPAAELEKQFTEFQVAETADGRIVAAIALQLAGSNGKIHSEAFADFALSDTLRPLFWQRLETMARNHGLFRLWTAETAPFWKKDAGFSAPQVSPPEIFGPASAAWLSLRLKDESADPNLLEAEFNLFRDAERARRDKLLQHAAALKVIGTVITVLIFIFSIAALVWVIKHRSK